MTKRERFEIMKAYYEEGKTIESRFLKDGPNGRWYYHDSEPDWNWDYSEYRVQQEETEQKIRPYENAEEFMQAMKKHGPYLRYKPNRNNSDMYYYIPTYINNDSFGVCTNKHDGVMYYTFDELLSGNDAWQDGTPCGIIE